MGIKVIDEEIEKVVDDTLHRRKEDKEVKLDDVMAIRKPMNTQEAVIFFDYVKSYGQGFYWSIKHYNYTENLTFNTSDNNFIDFDVVKGDPVSWDKLQEVLVESAQRLWFLLRPFGTKNIYGDDEE